MNLSPYVYRCPKNEFPLYFFAYRRICGKIFDDIVRDVRRRVESLRQSHFLNYETAWIYPKFSNHAQRVIQKIKKEYTGPSDKKFALIGRVAELAGLAFDEQLACMSRAAENAAADLAALQRPFPAEKWEEVHKIWKRSLEIFREDIMRQRGIKKVAEGIPLSPEDRKFLKLRRKDESDYDDLDPAGYVFLKLREPEMQYFCKYKSLQLDLYFGDSFNTLASWGYRPIKKPAPGDIAVYLSGNAEPGKYLLRHYAIYLGRGMVQSKYGRYSYSGIYKHRVFDIPLDYGLKVVFLRKN